MTKLKLDDSVIAHIVKLVQLGLLQGLDVVDYFRQIELIADDKSPNSNLLLLDNDYLERHEAEVQHLLNVVESKEANNE